MKILVTGATGFVGRHLVPRLLAGGHSVTATGRSTETARPFGWFPKVRFVEYDISADNESMADFFGKHDLLIHLVWPDARNHNDIQHIETHFHHHANFLKCAVRAGYDRLMVTGSCFEYGLKDGALTENLETAPTTPYGLAKDGLRKYLEFLQKEFTFKLQWARLFYLYGEGQNPKCLIPQLETAIMKEESLFKMSGGEQLRDYMSIDKVVDKMAYLVQHDEITGVINCCSGKPVSIRKLVEDYIIQKGASMPLELGYYPYSRDETMAFWGVSEKFDRYSGK